MLIKQHRNMELAHDGRRAPSRPSMRHNPIKIIGAAVLATIVAGCAANPERAGIIAAPKTPAVKNITSFTPALQCMDNLFGAYGKRDIIITSAGIPDATGQIRAGTKDMMISAISKMSRKSKAFRFIDFDQNQTDILAVQQLIGVTNDILIPNYYIRGAITQLDAGVANDRVGGGIAIPQGAIGVNRDQLVSVVSMDLNMGDIVTRQIISGIQATNSIAIVRKGQGADFDGQIGKVGLFFNVSMDRSEGPHASVRTLIELSLIEVLGKLTQVPYWKCLEIPQTNPQMMVQARDWYDTMNAKDRTLLIQRALIGGGYMGGTATGVIDRPTQTAISRYKAENDLVANGRIDFDLYYSLLGRNLVLASLDPKAGTTGSARPKQTVPKKVKLAPLNIKVTTNKGARPRVRVGEKLVLKVNLNEGAHVYCYYQDAKKNVARIFPNRFAPDSYVSPTQPLTIPDEFSSFDIVMEQAGAKEQIDCLASRREIGIGLPRAFMVDDLTPIRGKTMKDVIAEYKRVDRLGLAHQQLSISVSR